MKKINVNELVKMIEKHTGLNGVKIESVMIADMENQFNPRKYEIGIGGVLTIEYTIWDEELKPNFKNNCKNCKENNKVKED